MQTFMPYGKNYDETARCLDNKRLGKQRVETYQILRILTGETSKGWVNHPATRMWEGHEFQLYLYQTAICAEWSRRGFKDTVFDSCKLLIQKHRVKPTIKLPDWMSNPAMSITHKANLYLKDPFHYVEFQEDAKVYLDYICCDSCKYFWPTHATNID